MSVKFVLIFGLRGYIRTIFIFQVQLIIMSSPELTAEELAECDNAIVRAGIPDSPASPDPCPEPLVDPLSRSVMIEVSDLDSQLAVFDGVGHPEVILPNESMNRESVVAVVPNSVMYQRQCIHQLAALDAQTELELTIRYEVGNVARYTGVFALLRRRQRLVLYSGVLLSNMYGITGAACGIVFPNAEGAVVILLHSDPEQFGLLRALALQHQVLTSDYYVVQGVLQTLVGSITYGVLCVEYISSLGIEPIYTLGMETSALLEMPPRDRLASSLFCVTIIGYDSNLVCAVASLHLDEPRTISDPERVNVSNYDMYLSARSIWEYQVYCTTRLAMRREADSRSAGSSMLDSHVSVDGSSTSVARKSKYVRYTTFRIS